MKESATAEDELKSRGVMVHPEELSMTVAGMFLDTSIDRKQEVEVSRAEGVAPTLT
jgi:hypothetical protein